MLARPASSIPKMPLQLHYHVVIQSGRMIGQPCSRAISYEKPLRYIDSPDHYEMLIAVDSPYPPKRVVL